MLGDLKRGISRRVGDGSSIRFWTDLWSIEDISLLSFVICEVPSKLVHKRVNFFATDNDWSWHLFK